MSETDAGNGGAPQRPAEREGGDPACWLASVCPDCGFYVEDERAGVCPRCGIPLHDTE